MYFYLVNFCQTMPSLCLRRLNVLQMATCEAGTIVLISKGETEVRRAITIAQITECAVREEAALLLTSENPEEKKRLNKREKTSTGTKALVGVGGCTCPWGLV